MNRFVCGILFCIALSGTAASLAQKMTAPESFSRKNTYSVFAEYSNTSSHILMGAARQRILADFGGGYTRRVVRFWGTDLGYHIELEPVLFESDPIEIVSTVFNNDGFVNTLASAAVGVCKAGSGTFTFVGPPGAVAPTETYTTACGRQWTFGQEFAPIGFKYAMRTSHPLQPFILGSLGYMYTSRPVPVADAESFNFVFDFGGGIEMFRSRTKKRSVALEVLFHHFSNRGTAPENPGTDNLMYRLSCSFGR